MPRLVPASVEDASDVFDELLRRVG